MLSHSDDLSFFVCVGTLENIYFACDHCIMTHEDIGINIGITITTKTWENGIIEQIFS